MTPGESAAAKAAAREAQTSDIKKKVLEEEAKQAAKGIEVIPKDEAKRRLRENRTIEVSPEGSK
ncbi:MAG: hypothetical protein ACKVPX_11785 [Myxococcaceae bacterium]